MANDINSRVKALEAEISGSGKRSAATALPSWIPSFLVDYALAIVLTQLKGLIKSESGKATLKKVLKRVFDGIVLLYPDDPSFQNCPDE